MVYGYTNYTTHVRTHGNNDWSNDMIVEIFLLVLSITVVSVIWHFVDDWYQEREWRRNNPEEHDIMNKPVKKDPGLD